MMKRLKACLKKILFLLALHGLACSMPCISEALDFVDRKGPHGPALRHDTKIPVAFIDNAVRFMDNTVHYIIAPGGTLLKDIPFKIIQEREKLGLPPEIPLGQQEILCQHCFWKPDKYELIEFGMSAKVIEVFAQKGQHVQAGDKLIKIESMKMLMDIYSPSPGEAKDIFVKVGDIKSVGEQIITLVSPSPNWEAIDPSQIMGDFLRNIFPWETKPSPGEPTPAGAIAEIDPSQIMDNRNLVMNIFPSGPNPFPNEPAPADVGAITEHEITQYPTLPIDGVLLPSPEMSSETGSEITQPVDDVPLNSPEMPSETTSSPRLVARRGKEPAFVTAFPLTLAPCHFLGLSTPKASLPDVLQMDEGAKTRKSLSPTGQGSTEKGIAPHSGNKNPNIRTEAPLLKNANSEEIKDPAQMESPPPPSTPVFKHKNIDLDDHPARSSPSFGGHWTGGLILLGSLIFTLKSISYCGLTHFFSRKLAYALSPLPRPMYLNTDDFRIRGSITNRPAHNMNRPPFMKRQADYTKLGIK